MEFDSDNEGSGIEETGNWPNWDPLRISMTTAKKRYKVSKADLAELTDRHYRSNPYHHRTIVTLFLISEVQALAQRKAAAREAARRYKAEHAEEIAADKAEKAAAARHQAADRAAETLDSYKSCPGAVGEGQGGSLRLPEGCLEVILDCLIAAAPSSPDEGAGPGRRAPAGAAQQGGLQGLAELAAIRGQVQQMATLAMVCVDTYRAVHSYALPALADRAAAVMARGVAAPPWLPQTVLARDRSLKKAHKELQEQLAALAALPGVGDGARVCGVYTRAGPRAKELGWPLWGALVRDPAGTAAAHKLDTLKEAARLAKAKTAGTKAELAVRLVAALRAQALLDTRSWRWVWAYMGLAAWRP